MVLLYIITVLFIIYCSTESLASIARHAGSKTKRYSLGLMLSNQIYSINRLNGFLIAPLLGLYVDHGGSVEELRISAKIGCVVSAIILAAILKIWPLLLRICMSVLGGIELHGFSYKVLRHVIISNADGACKFNSRKKDFLVVFSQSLTTSLATPTAFVLNILAIRFPEYKATLVQSATVISGAGNLALNFYIFPKVALAETRGDPDGMYYSMMLGKIFGIGILSTCMLTII